MATDDTLGPREQLERERRIALSIANRMKRLRYLEIDVANFTQKDAHGELLSNENDPLLDALVKQHW